VVPGPHFNDSFFALFSRMVNPDLSFSPPSPDLDGGPMMEAAAFLLWTGPALDFSGGSDLGFQRVMRGFGLFEPIDFPGWIFFAAVRWIHSFPSHSVVPFSSF